MDKEIDKRSCIERHIQIQVTGYLKCLLSLVTNDNIDGHVLSINSRERQWKLTQFGRQPYNSQRETGRDMKQAYDKDPYT